MQSATGRRDPVVLIGAGDAKQRHVDLCGRLLGSVEDAEDVVHDVFLGLPEVLHRYEERGHFEAWLLEVNGADRQGRLRTTRRRNRVVKRGGNVESVAGSAPAPSDAIVPSVAR